MINSTQVNQTFNLQAFCTAALMSQRRITIGLDSNLVINLFNAEAEQYFDLVASTCLGQSYDLLSNYLELDEMTKVLTEKSLKPLVMQTNILTKVVNSSSLSKYLSWSVQQVIDENQLFLGFLLVGKEVESPVVEQTKTLSNISLENLINKIPGSIYFKDINGKYLWCNDFVVKMAGKNSIFDILGKNDYQLFPRDISDQWRENDKEVMDTGKEKITEEMVRISDETALTFLGYKSPLYDENGKLIGIIGNSLDISNQKKIVAKLEKYFSKQKETLYYLSNFANNLPGSLYFKSVDGKYLWCNDFVVRMAGKQSINDIVGKTDYELCWKNLADDYKKNDQEVITSRQPKVMEETLILADGSKLPLLTNKTPVFDEVGKIIGIMGNSLDITTQKAVEDTLRMAKETAEAANRAKTQFIANVSHDMRTPLAGIYGLAQILVDLVPEQYREEMQDILNSSNQLLKFLTEVIDLSKIEAHEQKEVNTVFNFRHMLNELAELYVPTAKQKNIQLKFHYDHAVPDQFYSHQKTIHRILVNLIGNALKFTAVGGISVTIQLDKEANLANNPKSIPIKIMITDSGIGIPEEHQEKIFERFHRVHPSYEGVYQGTGLGLYITQQLVSDLNGKIWVDSQLGQGSTFYITFALAATDPTSTLPADTHKASTSINNANIKVLVVEDNLIAQKVCEMLLKKLGVEVNIAGDGKQALQAIERNQYDLILMDIGLPDGMSGIDVTAAIRQLPGNINANTPIVALTAHLPEQARDECLQVGMNEVLQKPITEQKARDILSRFVEKG